MKLSTVGTFFLTVAVIRSIAAGRVVRQEVQPPIICANGDGIVQISIFKYQCKDYAATFIACAGNPRTKGQEIAAGETKLIDGFWYKCFEENGRARFLEELRCLAGEGKVMHLDSTETIGDFEWYCRPDMLAEIKGCYFKNMQGERQKVPIGGIVQVDKHVNMTCVGNADQIQKQLAARARGEQPTGDPMTPRGGMVPVGARPGQSTFDLQPNGAEPTLLRIDISNMGNEQTNVRAPMAPVVFAAQGGAAESGASNGQFAGCTEHGSPYKHGDTWIHDKLRYLCDDGTLQTVSCVDEHGDEIMAGRQVVENNYLQKCARKIDGGLTFTSGVCGTRGFNCEVPPMLANYTTEEPGPTLGPHFVTLPPPGKAAQPNIPGTANSGSIVGSSFASSIGSGTRPASSGGREDGAPLSNTGDGSSPASSSSGGSNLSTGSNTAPSSGATSDSNTGSVSGSNSNSVVPAAPSPSSGSDAGATGSVPVVSSGVQTQTESPESEPIGTLRADGICYHNGQPHNDSETWIDREVRYICTKGKKTMTACVLKDGELKAGQWVIQGGIMQKCSRTKNGLEYGRGRCGAPGIDCQNPGATDGSGSNSGSSQTTGSANNGGASTSSGTLGQSATADGSSASANPAAAVVASKPSESDQSNGKGDGDKDFFEKNQFQGRQNGTCTHNGVPHEEGETWIDREVRYECKKGVKQMVACVLKEGGELLAGQRSIKGGIMQKCDRTANGLEFGRGKCGAPGIKCESSATSDDDITCYDTGKQHKNGDTWTARGVRYLCAKGGVQLTACVLADGSEIPPGQNVIKNGILHKCIRTADGGIAYGSGYCNTPGFQCGGTVRRVARDTPMFLAPAGQQSAPFMPANNQQQMGFQQQPTQQGQQQGDSQAAGGAGGRPDGSCYDNGKQYQNGETWRDREVRYACSNGKAQMTACVLSDNSELQAGQRIVKNGVMFKCDRTADGGLEYGAGSCNAPGFQCDNLASVGGASGGGTSTGVSGGSTGNTGGTGMGSGPFMPSTGTGGSSQGNSNPGDQMGSSQATGYCINEGKQYSNGATFTTARLRYVCSSGKLQPIACILPDGTELPADGSVTRDGAVHKCVRMSDGNLMYRAGTVNGGGDGGSMTGTGGQTSGGSSGTQTGTSGGGSMTGGGQEGAVSTSDAGGQSGPSCTDHDKEYKSGETWSDGYFRYKCDAGATKIDACVLPDRSEVEGGKSVVKFDILYRCVKKPDGGLLYQMAICGTENVNCDDPSTFENVGGQANGTSKGSSGGGGGLSMGPAGSPSPAPSLASTGGAPATSSSGAGASSGSADGMGVGGKECVKDGHTIMPGGVFISNNFKYVCKPDGTVSVLGCRTDSRQEIKVGEVWVIGGFQHSCLSQPNGAAYSLQKCGGRIQCGSEGLQKTP